MLKSNVVNFGDYFNLPNPGLKTYFAGVREGYDEVIRTTFYRGETPTKILNRWMPTIESLDNVWPTLVEFENDLAEKVGPLSVMKPLKDRVADMDAYYEGILLPSKSVSHSAIAAVLKEWNNVRGMQIRKQEHTVEKMKKSTNSGSPYFTRRKTVTGKTVPCGVYQNGKTTWQVLDGKEWKACAILGWRGQEGGPAPDDVKQRVVWMFPYAVNICELQVYQPLIELAQREGLVPAWVGQDSVDNRVTSLFDTKGKEDLILCTDFTKFDQHIGVHCQEAAKTILEGILADGKEWINTVFPIKYNIQLAYDWGQIRSGPHGMGSGSGGTNVDETLLHRALQYEAAQAVGKMLNPNSQCLGDDGILSYPGITAEDVMRSYTSHGLSMNLAKQYASTQDCTYLRRWYHKDYRVEGVCRGVYATSRALGRLCYQERYYDPEIWSKEMVALRQLSIIENVKYHPLNSEFADFCMKGDKYRLGLDIPGFLDHIEKYAKEAIDLMPDFLGYTRSLSKKESTGISEWWIVKYLKSKA